MQDYIYNDELYHHGIKGQKWGVRRFQNEDGSLTPAGERRYNDGAKVDGYSKPRLPYGAKQRNDIAKSRTAGLTSALSGMLLAGGSSLYAVKFGRSFVTDTVASMGAGMTVGGLAVATIQQGRLWADNSRRKKNSDE